MLKAVELDTEAQIQVFFKSRGISGGLFMDFRIISVISNMFLQ